MMLSNGKYSDRVKLLDEDELDRIPNGISRSQTYKPPNRVYL